MAWDDPNNPYRRGLLGAVQGMNSQPQGATLGQTLNGALSGYAGAMLQDRAQQGGLEDILRRLQGGPQGGMPGGAMGGQTGGMPAMSNQMASFQGGTPGGSAAPGSMNMPAGVDLQQLQRMMAFQGGAQGGSAGGQMGGGAASMPVAGGVMPTAPGGQGGAINPMAHTPGGGGVPTGADINAIINRGNAMLPASMQVTPEAAGGMPAMGGGGAPPMGGQGGMGQSGGGMIPPTAGGNAMGQSGGGMMIPQASIGGAMGGGSSPFSGMDPAQLRRIFGGGGIGLGV